MFNLAEIVRSLSSLVTLRQVCDVDDASQSKRNELTREWEELFRSSTTEYYEKVAAHDLAEFEPEEYFDRVRPLSKFYVSLLRRPGGTTDSRRRKEYSAFLARLS